MATRQFIACAFRKGDTRTYTYHNDREAIAVGDEVIVTTARGPSKVFVSALIDEAPKFETKPIVGLAPKPVAEPRDTLDDGDDRDLDAFLDLGARA